MDVFLNPAYELNRERTVRAVGPGLAKSKERKGRRVLLVDDEEMFATMGQKTLSKVGFDVTAVTDSEKALECFQSNPLKYDVVMADRTMPVLDGYSLAAKLQEIRPSIPIVIVSGYDEAYGSAHRDGIRVSAYAQKPFSISELARILDRAIDNP